jgi:uncharacterized protein
MAKKRKSIIIILIIIIALIILYLFVPRNVGTLEKKSPEELETPANVNTEVSEPKFKKEGELTFLSPNKAPIKKIDIEIADNEADRELGLMYRKSMADSLGMLFKFETSYEQNFWMKNTIISLDIIYIDENKQVVSIQKYAVPYSEKTLPSYKNAQYVVEVNAGFCDKYGIKEGCFISF